MPVLDIQGVYKRFRRLDVLTGTSLNVEQGEIVGVTGENGAGKTTLLRIIVGLLGADSGHIAIDGSQGYCPQDPILFDALTMEENLAYFAAGYGLSPSERRSRTESLIERLHCQEHASKTVATLSAGTKQKLNLIVALLHDPTLLILDEPYQGFDYESYLTFWELAEELKNQGKSLLVVSHLILDRDRLDRIYTLREGRAHLED
ncbi:MAG: ABC transporter ATP-binding protein [Anaerolineae bacterium]